MHVFRSFVRSIFFLVVSSCLFRFLPLRERVLLLNFPPIFTLCCLLCCSFIRLVLFSMNFLLSVCFLFQQSLASNSMGQFRVCSFPFHEFYACTYSQNNHIFFLGIWTLKLCVDDDDVHIEQISSVFSNFIRYFYYYGHRQKLSFKWVWLMIFLFRKQKQKQNRMKQKQKIWSEQNSLFLVCVFRRRSPFCIHHTEYWNQNKRVFSSFSSFSVQL